MSERIEIPKGSVEFLRVAVSADTVLDGQVWIAVTTDLADATWTSAEWVGEPALSRTARISLDTSDLRTGVVHTIYVRFVAQFEQPVIDAGELIVLTT